MVLLLSDDFFSELTFSKISSRNIFSACQTVWIQLRNDILYVLIWVQMVCKDYQLRQKVGASRERVNGTFGQFKDKITVNSETFSRIWRTSG